MYGFIYHNYKSVVYFVIAQYLRHFLDISVCKIMWLLYEVFK